MVSPELMEIMVWCSALMEVGGRCCSPEESWRCEWKMLHGRWEGGDGGDGGRVARLPNYGGPPVREKGVVVLCFGGWVETWYVWLFMPGQVRETMGLKVAELGATTAATGGGGVCRREMGERDKKMVVCRRWRSRESDERKGTRR
ncbi:hypothetical protein HAX54_022864 [Datura stramonium]|uniref:Uncharacterized protein n=1 Tax=Datura stramonium TaxID=4076 RepID=A0ABS8UV98_DATST|nr:hypothetical protein [Datura stramonium]